ncbi:MAG: sigma-E processing peptidase SpoIIGA, partial [Anaerovoracaceae bacterium]|nr:sigma-E processing peptidase SpoIIGA [Anaerovoracaceae bacterium]
MVSAGRPAGNSSRVGRRKTGRGGAVQMEIDRRRKWPMGAAYWQEENMVVYGEYLFLENFITGLLLLYLTARLVMPGRGPVQIMQHQSPRQRQNGRIDAIGHEVRQRSGCQIAAIAHEVRLWRLLAGAAVCGGCGFLIFLPLQPAVGILVRGLLSAAVTAAALGRAQLVRKTAVFLVLTFLTGGTAMAVLLWRQEPAIAGNGAMYV